MGIRNGKIEDIDLTEFFENDFTDNTIDQSKKIILEYTEQDYEKVIDAIQKIGGSPEKVFWELLNL